MKEKCIYLWRNKITNKTYIGKTNNRQCRYDWFTNWDIHYAGPHIDKARKKYNDIKYWEYQILCRCDTEEELNEQEKYYIAIYNSNDKFHGYNISSGGTFGDTWSALTEEERKERLEKQRKTRTTLGYKWMYKDNECQQIDKYHQEEYLNNGWSYGLSKDIALRISNSMKQSEKHKAACRKRRLSDEELAKRGQKRIEDLEAYRQSQEYIDKIKRNKEKSGQRITEYNKSEAHRQAAIESNKRRWKNGCPEETRKKMRASSKHKVKGTIWINKEGSTKMIKPEEYDKYINNGWTKGRGTNCVWNTKRCKKQQ